MTALRKRMIEDLQLRGYSKRTIQMYVRAVRQLAQFYNLSPDQISEEQLRKYLLNIKNNKKWSPSAITIALSGIKFFYTYTLQKEMPIFNLARAKREEKLPVILTRDEVRLILKNLKMIWHRVCLKTIYSLGLRISEGISLKVNDIDSKRMFVHIKAAKGKKDRYVPLPQKTLQLLREFYKIHRNPLFIFPAPGRGRSIKKMSKTQKYIPLGSVQDAFRDALNISNINKNVSVHHLRHSYAVHLLEAGVNIRYIQEYLGHKDIKTTMIYTKLVHQSLLDPMPLINQIMADL